jgi:lipoyl(octanoyl) transferase
MHQVRYIDLGLKDYKETWDYQQEIQNNLIKAKAAGNPAGSLQSLIFVEHPHVYTLGKSGKENNLLINDDFLATIHATYYHTDRGGDITYHGPGQLVGYPIFDLDRIGSGIKHYINTLEDSIIQTLAEFNIQASRLEGATGVWITSKDPIVERKICAIGVKVSRGITMHGFALNVNTNLEYFAYINPCGFTNKGVTSIEKETGEKADMKKVKEILAEKIEALFDLKITID